MCFTSTPQTSSGTDRLEPRPASGPAQPALRCEVQQDGGGGPSTRVAVSVLTALWMARLLVGPLSPVVEPRRVRLR